MFDLKLSNSATEFKSAYEKKHPKAKVWEPFLKQTIFSVYIFLALICFATSF